MTKVPVVHHVPFKRILVRGPWINDRCTPKQREYVQDLCKKNNLDPPEGLETYTKLQVTHLIDELKNLR